MHTKNIGPAPHPCVEFMYNFKNVHTRSNDARRRALYWDKQIIVIVSLLDYLMAELGCEASSYIYNLILQKFFLFQ